MSVVKVYRNLHKNCYSIMQNGKVVGYQKEVFLKFCELTVSQKGRARVLATGHKNVHAFVKGYLLDTRLDSNDWNRVYYNPRKYEDWTNDSGNIVTWALFVHLNDKFEVRYSTKVLLGDV